MEPEVQGMPMVAAATVLTNSQGFSHCRETELPAVITSDKADRPNRPEQADIQRNHREEG